MKCSERDWLTSAECDAAATGLYSADVKPFDKPARPLCDTHGDEYGRAIRKHHPGATVTRAPITQGEGWTAEK